MPTTRPLRTELRLPPSPACLSVLAPFAIPSGAFEDGLEPLVEASRASRTRRASR